MIFSPIMQRIEDNMAKRFIDEKIWSDPWFQELDPLLKLFWIYMFSSCDIIGRWEINKKRAEFDIGKSLPWEKIKENLKFHIHFGEKYWTINAFIKQQYPKIFKSPNAPLHIAVFNELNKNCLNLNGNSLSIDYGNTIDSVAGKGIGNTSISSNTRKQKTSNTSGDSEKIPPIIEMVRDYCRERGNGIDPEKWYNHYEAKDWMIGKNRMKNWKAAVRTWEPPGFKPGERDVSQLPPKIPATERASPDEIRDVFRSINSIADKMGI